MSSNDATLSFRVLKKQVTIGQVLAVYGLTEALKRRGEQLYGPCPLHGGDNPTAFRIHLQRGIWRCFTSCGGGDVVELIRRIERCDYAAAALHLRRIALGQPPSSPQAAVQQSTLPARVPDFRPFRRRIPLNPRTPFLQRDKGIAAHIAAHFEAGWTNRSTFLHDTVAVRLHDIHGNPLGYCGRRLLPDQIARWGKWRFPKHFPKSQVLYNAHRAIHARANGVVIVECPWAAMRLVQAGIPGAVALLGTELSDTHAEWLSAAPRVLLLLDGDKTGRNAARCISRRLAEVTTTIVHDLHVGCEPEDLTDPQLSAIARDSLPFSLNQYPFPQRP